MPAPAASAPDKIVVITMFLEYDCLPIKDWLRDFLHSCPHQCFRAIMFSDKMRLNITHNTVSHRALLVRADIVQVVEHVRCLSDVVEHSRLKDKIRLPKMVITKRISNISRVL